VLPKTGSEFPVFGLAVLFSLNVNIFVKIVAFLGCVTLFSKYFSSVMICLLYFLFKCAAAVLHQIA
jgi:hypothetical protein